MADKQYYVKMNFEFGTDVDGVLTQKTTGEILWSSMPYADAVLLQHQVLIPMVNDGLVKAGELGIAAAEAKLPVKPA